ncbi:MFS transporter [Bradyrhizobium sp. B117]|uniref:MFS transporter n=1 Tax=Bradyrhizobium sp. B117 TaxID=3140246 RepID=UPI0031832E24
MFEWYRELAPAGRRTFWACFGGYALDAFDVQIYSFILPILIGLKFIDATEAGLLATTTLVLSAFGGWFAGMLSDRVGRVRTLQITVIWFAFFTFLSGFAQNFEQLMVTRGLMGLGFGGEWAAGSVLIGEVIAARHRGKAVGFVQGSWSVGWAAAALVATLLFTTLDNSLGWRILFFIGIAPAFVTFWIRRVVPEPEVFATAKASGAPKPSLVEIFRPALLWTTIRASLLALGAQGGYYAITTWLPRFLSAERHITILDSLGYISVVIAGSFTGYVTSAYLGDAIGRRTNFMLFAIGSAAIVLIYTQISVSNELMLVLGFPLGFFASGIFSGMGPVMTELFPTEVRGTGQGFCYNVGRGLAAFFPTLVGVASASMSLGIAIGMFAAAAYGLVIVAALLLPETQGQSLFSLAEAEG